MRENNHKYFKKQCLISLFAFNLILLSTACKNAISATEYNALYSLYSSTGGQHWHWLDGSDAGGIWHFNTSVETNDEFSEPCMESWQGLICNYLTEYSCFISEIDLPAFNMSGQIPADLSAFQNVSYLNFGFNFLTGTLPSSIGQLIQLELLSFYDNEMSGPIPDCLGYLQNLVYFSLYFNYFTGTIPLSLGNLDKISLFSLYGNMLTGPIPDSIGSLTSAEEIYLYTNFLSGSIPYSIGYLKSVVNLYFNDNILTGVIPPTISNLISIRELNLYSNFLTGYLPSSLSNLTKVELLQVFGNFLSGTIPSDFASMEKLQYLYLEENVFTGSIPTSLGFLRNLVQLAVFTNLLTGTIPSSLGNLKRLTGLILYSNSLSGTIPSSVGDLPNLGGLQVNSNRLTGTIPSSIGTLSLLQYLYLFENFLTGSIPNSFANDAVSISDIVLYSNYFTASITSLLCNVTNLARFDVAYNFFTGTFPAAAKQALHLTDLYLNGNQFSGTVNDDLFASPGFQLLYTLDIADNQLTGTFPSNVFVLRNLVTLSASSNCFHGALEVPPCGASAAGAGTTSPRLETVELNGLSSGAACRNYFFRLPGLSQSPGYLPSNYMTGSIPSSLLALPRLSSVSLAGNGFTGTIDVPSSTKLTNINMAYNHLSGEIPSALQTLGVFDSLDLSYNRFSGTLSDSFCVNASSIDALNISVNRISGVFPANAQAVLTASTTVANVLLGNMFTFADSAGSGEATNESTALYNGSAQLNAAMGLGAAVFFLWVSIWLRPLIGCDDLAHLNAEPGVKPGMETKCRAQPETQEQGQLLARLIRWHGWSAAHATTGNVKRLLRVHNASVSFLSLAVGAFVILAVILATLKSISPTAEQYANYQFQYAWVVSAAFMHSACPSALCITALTVVSIVYAALFFPIESPRLPSSNERRDAKNLISSTLRKMEFLAASVLIVGVNGAVMLTFNFLYLQAVLASNPNLIFIQILLACFKVAWTKLFVSSASKAMRLRFGPGATAVLDDIQLSVLLFNFVIAPCIATALSDSSCFYELFNQRASQASSSRLQCIIYSFTYTNNQVDVSCISYGGSISLATQFDPPFIYSYQCGSALIVNYVPVLLYIFFLSGVVTPGSTLLCLVRPSLVDWIPSPLRSVVFPRIYLFDTTNKEPLHGDTDTPPEMLEGQQDSWAGTGNALSLPCCRLDSSNSSHTNAQTRANCSEATYAAREESKSSRRQSDVPAGQQEEEFAGSAQAEPRPSRPPRPPILLGGIFMNQLLLHFIVLFTFGLAAPYLAAVVGCSFCSQVATMRVLIGRYAYHHSKKTLPAQQAEPTQQVEPMQSTQESQATSDPELGQRLGQTATAAAPDSPRGGRHLTQGRCTTTSTSGQISADTTADTSASSYQQACEEIEEAIGMIWQYPFRNGWLVLLVGHIFWGLICFDMIGDVYGSQAALKSMITIVGCTPLVTYWLARAVLCWWDPLSSRCQQQQQQQQQQENEWSLNPMAGSGPAAAEELKCGSPGQTQIQQMNSAFLDEWLDRTS